jgi:hypothetical protein
MLPLVPVTVMMEVEVGTAKPVLVPLHPVRAVALARAAKASKTMNTRRCFHLLRENQMKPREATDATAGTELRGNGDVGGELRPETAGMVTVIVLLAACVVPGTMLPGEKLTKVPSGRPAAVRATALVKGLFGSAEVSCTT